MLKLIIVVAVLVLLGYVVGYHDGAYNRITVLVNEPLVASHEAPVVAKPNTRIYCIAGQWLEFQDKDITDLDNPYEAPQTCVSSFGIPDSRTRRYNENHSIPNTI